VLAVVVCGLAMSQVAPRIGRAAIRQQTTAFWNLATYVLNAALFVLVGIEAQSAVRDLVSADLLTALTVVLAVFAVILVVRMAFLVLAAYTIRLVDRPPQQRLRRVSNRSRVVTTVAGFRGAVSLAVALSMPTTLPSGQPFPDRDLIVFITAGVVAMTLVVQGLLLPATIRWARFPSDDRDQTERQLAEQVSTEEALAALDDVSAELGTEPAAAERLRTEYEEHLNLLRARYSDSDDPDPALRLDEQYATLKLALLARKRASTVRLRDERRIDDSVLRAVQARLDIEEVRLSRSEPADD
jgi:NhaP-type Na+/H+ or K+/H+ antiporter